MDNIFRKRQVVVLRVIFSLIVLFGVVLTGYFAEARSLKKGDIYRLLEGNKTIEVISNTELELTEGKDTFVAEYNFKEDKLRVAYTMMGTKMIKYYLFTEEGLKEEKSSEIYYSKDVLAKLKEKGDYTDNGNGTVTHKITKLMWQKENDNKKRNWDDAISYCKGLSLGGYNNWRLPEKEELQSSVDLKHKPTIDSIYFSNTEPSDYWSATTYANGSNYAWGVDFGNGYVGSSNKASAYYVRCIR